MSVLNGEFDIIRSLHMLPGIVLGLTVHEAAHAATANALGDRTAREQGRVTFNPLAHIDWLGLLFIFLVGFGWAKPVQFSEDRLKHPSRDITLIALAGPLANALLAVLGSVAFVALVHLGPAPSAGFGLSLLQMLSFLILINWGLFIFNLIPVPPLDGSHVVFQAFRHKGRWMEYFYRYGSFAFMAFILVSIAADLPLPFGTWIDRINQGCFGILTSIWP